MDENNEKNIQKKRIRVSIIKNTALTILCIALGLVIALQYKGIRNEPEIPQSTQEQINSLQNQLIKLTQESESLKNDKEQLQDKIDALQSEENQKYLESLKKELNDIKTFAGLTKVKGEGIYIKLSFTKETSYSSKQSYLTLVINDLRASNAQAISINGQRILAMSELRAASNGQISVNGKIINAPFEIYAIGDTSSLQSGMIMGGNGIIPTLESKKFDVQWQILEDIEINACEEDDFRIDLLNPAE